MIIVDTFSGDKVIGFLEALRQMGGDLAVRMFTLHVSENVLKERLEKRSGDEFKDFMISKKLNVDVLKTEANGEFRIDTSQLTPQQTAERMFSLLGVQQAL